MILSFFFPSSQSNISQHKRNVNETYKKLCKTLYSIPCGVGRSCKIKIIKIIREPGSRGSIASFDMECMARKVHSMVGQVNGVASRLYGGKCWVANCNFSFTSQHMPDQKLHFCHPTVPAVGGRPHLHLPTQAGVYYALPLISIALNTC
jgi:hypothetical protein